MSVTSVSDASGNTTQRAVNGTAIAPLLLGFSAPLLVIIFLNPPFLREARDAFIVLLAMMLIVVMGLFLFAVFMPRALKELRIDAANGRLLLTYANALSLEVQELDVQKIRSVRVNKSYDQDGYPVETGTIVMKDGSQVAVPFPPPPACVAAFTG